MQIIEHFCPEKFYTLRVAFVAKIIIPLFMSLYRYLYILQKGRWVQPGHKRYKGLVINLGQINGN